MAFFANTNITSVTIPGSIINFGHDAFDSCIDLTNAIISNGVTTIGTSAFEGCIAHNNVVIPGSIASIGIFAFVDCRNLNNVVISNGVTSIEAFAFSGTGLTTLILPATLTNIDPYAFQSCTNLTSITIPSTITNIADYVFSSCQNLRDLFLTGNAPTADSTFFDPDTNAVAYYMAATTGWQEFSAKTGVPTELWNPLIQTDEGNFGVRGDQFGFDIMGTTNIPIVVEACTDLTAPVWIPLQTASLTNGSFYFSEPIRSNVFSRYYRISSP